ncbi:Clustered mitochondria protein-like protein [Plecturocebus cupreus]
MAISPSEETKLQMFVRSHIIFSLGFVVSGHYKDFAGDMAASIAFTSDLNGEQSRSAADLEGLYTLDTVEMDDRSYWGKGVTGNDRCHCVLCLLIRLALTSASCLCPERSYRRRAPMPPSPAPTGTASVACTRSWWMPSWSTGEEQPCEAGAVAAAPCLGHGHPGFFWGWILRREALHTPLPIPGLPCHQAPRRSIWSFGLVASWRAVKPAAQLSCAFLLRSIWKSLGDCEGHSPRVLLLLVFHA